MIAMRSIVRPGITSVLSQRAQDIFALSSVLENQEMEVLGARFAQVNRC
jgi:hypothetical protein